MSNSQKLIQNQKCSGSEKTIATLIHIALGDFSAALNLNVQQVHFAPPTPHALYCITPTNAAFIPQPQALHAMNCSIFNELRVEFPALKKHNG